MSYNSGAMNEHELTVEESIPQKMDPFTIGNKNMCAKTVADNLSKILRIKEPRNSYGIG